MSGFALPEEARVVITGSGGQLGGYLRQSLVRSGAKVVGIGRQSGAGVDLEVDITNRSEVAETIDQLRPDVIIHAAAYTDVDGCERDPGRAEAVNVDGSRNIAEAASSVDAYLIAVGSDFVFSGGGGAPYSESDPTEPISVYGKSKLAGERAILETDSSFASARTAWLYGGSGKHFPRTVLNVVRDRGGMDVVVDEIGSPTFAGDLAAALIELAAVRGKGVFHLVNQGSTSRFAFARAIAESAGLDPIAVGPTTTSEFLAKYPLPARRPADSTLVNTRAAALGITLRPWIDAVHDYVPTLGRELGILKVPQEV